MMRLLTLNCPQAPSKLLPPGRLISQACLIATLLVGCGAQPVSNSPEHSPAVSPSQHAPASEGSDDEKQQNESSKDAAELDAEAPREEPEQEPSTFDGGPRPQKKKERFSLMENLQAEAQRLEGALDPEELSCSGAVPHRDAICSLAKRICTLDTPSTLEGAQDCEKAKKSCSDARARYEKKCT